MPRYSVKCIFDEIVEIIKWDEKIDDNKKAILIAEDT